MDVTGKTAVITGGSRGIGFSVAQRFAEADMNIVLTARTPDDLEQAADKLRKLGSGEVITLPGDVSNERHVDQWIEDILGDFDSIDVLVNNAGIMRRGSVEELTLGDYREVLEVNLEGTFLMCNRIVPQMKKQNGGYIFNMASYAGTKGLLGSGAYGASKAGVIRFSETLQREVAENNIKVTAISPAYVYTDMAKDADVNREEMIQPEDIAETMLYVMRLSKSAVVRNVVIERYGQL
ncbi:MAG: SDR family oxidoreductase [Candidatus Marinimicrobia bacterium]|nr:SDR family oxidoreductase [Candidatus Neomarinimicrobiota bacterium]MCF7827839.1 SDR family oxidoreductase [Candidatus Neomarinimicrobiota bacterium]MCF7879406.1 SDR family oxidoreductase [Candidatus Neomarinimicrobiota bacterium]